MKNIILLLLAVFSLSKTSAQFQLLKGKVVANADVEGIHILNKTALKYTLTDEKGYFEILVKTNDTLVFSGIAYQLKEVIVTPQHIANNDLRITLTERVTQLDEVVVGKVLTGSLGSDIANTDVEAPINFYDLGIPGHTGLPKTLGERKLIEATTGGSGIPLSPILNAISGRTKRLKKNLQIEQNLKCMENLKTEYTAILFDETTSEDVQRQFFSFILDSENFQSVCEDTNRLNKISFLQTQLKLFNDMLQARKN